MAEDINKQAQLPESMLGISLDEEIEQRKKTDGDRWLNNFYAILPTGYRRKFIEEEDRLNQKPVNASLEITWSEFFGQIDQAWLELGLTKDEITQAVRDHRLKPQETNHHPAYTHWDLAR